MNIGLILTAAGHSTRFGSNKLKIVSQGKPILAHAADSFAKISFISQRIVSLSSESQPWAETLASLNSYKKVNGGASRALSVRNAFEALDVCDVVLVHDAARPFVPEEVIHRLLAAYQDGWPCVIPVLPIADTIKQISQDHHVIQTLDRRAIVRVQTPQLLSYIHLKNAYKNCPKDILTHFTDEAMLFEHLGHAVFTVPGDESIKKMTWKEDVLHLK